MMIWKNTATLNGFDDGLKFTDSKIEGQILLLGSKPINLNDFPNVKGIFRAGIGKDNVPEKDADARGVKICYPSEKTTEILYNETAIFTCSIIFKMVYNNVGSLDPWIKFPRSYFCNNTLLVIGTGNIGSRLVQYMQPLLNVITFDLANDEINALNRKLSQADYISLHIPNTKDNIGFINQEKLSMMKNNATLINTARAQIVDENALYDEIKSGRLRAAFDVFWNEPYTGKLKKFHPNTFYMTPHVASTSSEFLLGCRSDLDRMIEGLI